jgi:uncharacterized protein involved in exopolysaccharide biosynthesis
MKPKLGPGLILAIGRFLLAAVLRNWMWLPLPLAVGGAATVAAAYTLSKQTWESSGVMIYSPLPVPEDQRGLFLQQELPTLVNLVRSPSVLDGLREEFQLDVPVQMLEKAFKVTSQRNTQTISVSVQWAEPTTSAALVNRLMERFIDLIREFRRGKATEYLTDYEARLAACDAQHTAASAAYREHFRKHNLFDAKDDLENLRREIDSLLYSRSLVLRDEPVTRSKRDRVLKDLSELRQQEAAAEEEAKRFDAAQDNVTDARRRQDRLRELIEDEKQRQTLMVELTAKRKDYEKRFALLNQGAESRAVIDSLAAEIEVLTARLTDSKSVTKWKEELAEIDKIVVPNSKGPRQGSPIISQTLMKKLDFDIELIGLEKQQFEISRQLASARKRQEELRTLMTQAEGLEKEMTARSDERVQLSAQVVLFRRLRDQKAGEFSIISRATPAPYPAGSSRKLIYIGGFAATVMLALGLVCWRAWRQQYHGGRAVAFQWSLPVLADVDDSATAERQFVTELRRWQPGYGTALVWVDPGAQSGQTDPVFARLMSRLAVRDERVLVVDCRLHSPAPTPGQGLADVLTLRRADWDGLLQVGPAAGVDLLPAGSPTEPDVLSGHLLRRIVSEAASRYSLVLLIASHHDETDTLNSLLAATSGAIVCLSRQTSRGQLASRLKPLLQHYPERLRAVIVR